MITPTIHLNGSPADHLIDQCCEAAHALHLALEKMADGSPNGRDYYPQGPDALAKAEAEHRARVAKVKSVLDEYMALAEHITHDEDERKAR